MFYKIILIHVSEKNFHPLWDLIFVQNIFLSVLLDLFYFILVTKLNYWQMFILVLFLFSSNIYGPWDEAVIKE